MPRRLQRKRERGWRKPAGAIYVGRPTIFGNPFVGEPAAAVAAYRQWLTGRCQVSVGPGLPIERMEYIPTWNAPEEVRRALHELRGHDLLCWCREGTPCHADVLIELANR